MYIHCFIIDRTEREDFAGFLWMRYSGLVQIMIQISIKIPIYLISFRGQYIFDTVSYMAL